MTGPLLMYASENLTRGGADRRRLLGTAEIKFLRRVSGCSLCDHIHVYRNVMRTRLGISNLEETIQ
jgi:hypothetical protein